MKRRLRKLAVAASQCADHEFPPRMQVVMNHPVMSDMHAEWVFALAKTNKGGNAGSTSRP